MISPALVLAGLAELLRSRGRRRGQDSGLAEFGLQQADDFAGNIRSSSPVGAGCAVGDAY